MRINISNHAYWDRYKLYDGRLRRTKLAARVDYFLRNMLRAGAKPKDGRVHVQVSEYCIAVCVPGKIGGWDVVTFLPTELADKEGGANENMEDNKRAAAGDL